MMTSLPFIEGFALNLAMALVILVVGWSISIWVGRSIHALATRSPVETHAFVLHDPKPQVVVSDYRDNMIFITIRAWTQASQYWDLRYDLYRNGVEILKRVSAAAEAAKAAG